MSKTLIVFPALLKAHIGSYTRKDGTFVKEHDDKRQAAAPGAPNEGEVGHHEHTTYGSYFKKGEKVRDDRGNQHVVLSHVGPEVKTAGGKSFHPTKLSRVGGNSPKLDDDYDFHAHLGKMKDGETHTFGNSRFAAEKFDVTKKGDRFHLGNMPPAFFESQPANGHSHEEMAAKLGRLHGQTKGPFERERLVRH